MSVWALNAAAKQIAVSIDLDHRTPGADEKKDAHRDDVSDSDGLSSV